MPKQPNGLTKKAPKDSDGNLLGCPFCDNNDISKNGFRIYKGAGIKRQRYYCFKCDRNTLKPRITEYSDFVVQDIPVEEMPIEDIIEYRNKKYALKYDAFKKSQLIDIRINIKGVVGICHFGDPHVDDDGTNLAEIYALCDLIRETEGLFAGNLGDVQNNWIGRLQALYGQQSTTAKESWLITEHFLNSVDWVYLIAGNHDVWSGDGDPLEFIMRDKKSLYKQHGARMNLRFPNGKCVRVNARHQFKGNSMWNTAHAVSKAVQMGWRDHILTAGHIHVSGYQVLKDPASGLISHALQIASFKNMDEYAIRLGLEDKNIFNAPVTIIDPKYDDSDNRLITTFFNPFEGADYLKFKRKAKS